MLLLHVILAAGDRLPKTPRFQHTMEIFDGQLCVFGGKDTTGNNVTDYLLDYRCVDITKSVKQASPDWRLQSSASQFVMPPLAQHTTVYDRANHIIVPFGGQSPVGFSKAANFAVYCTLFQAWGKSNVVDEDIRRYLHTSVLQEKSGDMIIFGGASDGTTADTQNLTVDEGMRWKNVFRLVLDDARHNASSASPKAALGKVLEDNGAATPDAIDGLIQHSSVLLNDTQMVVLGGNTVVGSGTNATAVAKPFDLLYIYDLDTMKWRTQSCIGDIPPPRSVFSASQHERHIYMFGGVNVTGWSLFFNDLYELDTLTWSWRKMPTPNVPVPRYAHQMKTLGNYLIITHGYIQLTDEEYGGDEDIYFYDLNRESFVDRFSPSGISKHELDTEWREQRTATTNGVAVVCHLLALLVALLAVYYLLVICRDQLVFRARPRARRQSNREGIRSIVESYTETLRPSMYFGRASQDVNRKSFLQESKSVDNNNNNNNVHSMSEGTTTIIDSEQTNALREAKRHARILDEDASTPYVSRKLTLSAHIPTYNARRSSAVRFTPSIQSGEQQDHIELNTISSHSDDESLDDLKSPLAIVNPDDN
ncbi:hypothetical protein IWW50_000220 [Coemansia erecta]|nr:hypothetical protein IWW50_000220 [Coemansia erecta]